jgi:LCP family protein required for cell wall assembly
MARKGFKGFDKGLILIIIIFLVASGTGTFIYLTIRSDAISDAVQRGDHLAVLFLIHDGTRIVASELVLYHPATLKGAILDIPGETGLLIPDINKIAPIESVYDPKDPGKYIHLLESLLDTEIPYYIQIETAHMVRLVDLIEGVAIFIANPVEIVSTSNLVLLPSGSFVLDGVKALVYLTYTDELETDVERITRKQKFIQSLLKSLGEQQEYLSKESVASIMMKAIDSNLGEAALLALFREYGKLDTERMVAQRILGIHRMVDDQSLLFPHKDGIWLKETVRQTLDSLANTEIMGEEGLAVSLAILNGTTVNGLAGRTAQLFENYGYDVISVGNYTSLEEEFTRIVVLERNLEKGQRIAGLIRCTRIEIAEEEPAESIDSVEGEQESVDPEITIVLGKDFDGRYCK